MNVQFVHPRFGTATNSWLALTAVRLSVVVIMMIAAQATAQDTPGNFSISGGQLLHNGEAFQVIGPNQVPTAASIAADDQSFQPTDTADVPAHTASHSIGASHLPASVGGPCTTCGVRNAPLGMDPGFRHHHGGMGGEFAGGSLACPSCQPYRYLTVEGLYMERREGDNFTLARDFELDDFQYEWAPRITYGSVPDCVQGYELSFAGVLEWDIGLEAFDADDSLQTLLRPVSPLTVTDLDTFGNARSQVQTYDAEYWSAEASRTINGWGLSQFLYGVRYIDYSEEYNYTSFDPADGNGFVRADTENQLIGGQVGLDLIYPIARIAYLDFRGRAGAYANFADSAVDVVNNGIPLASTRSDDVNLAGMFELGTGIRVELGEMLSLRAGYELWYLTEIATAQEQLHTSVSRTLGSPIDAGDDIVIFGLSTGAELTF